MKNKMLQARDELRYILDPNEVHGEDFPGETFRVLKEKEIKQFAQEQYFKVVESTGTASFETVPFW